MSKAEIKILGKVLRIRKTVVSPDIFSEAVLISDPWEFVDLWLSREQLLEARSYWRQAREFSEASKHLSNLSTPLTAYYAILNATKTLLSAKSISFNESHGVSGNAELGRGSLSNEHVKFQQAGVLAELSRYLGEPTATVSYTLKDALYNLPFIHRAFTTTFTSSTDLFIPIDNIKFVRKPQSKKSWAIAQVGWQHANGHLGGKLPGGWEVDQSELPRGIRMKNRFDWDVNSSKSVANISKFQTYHRKVRKNLLYILGPSRLWYIKRSNVGTSCIDRSPMTLSYAAMHRLSELSRYDPKSLQKHLESRHNWLLSEFIDLAADQFIDEVAAEITGRDLLQRGIRG